MGPGAGKILWLTILYLAIAITQQARGQSLCCAEPVTAPLSMGDTLTFRRTAKSVVTCTFHVDLSLGDDPAELTDKRLELYVSVHKQTNKSLPLMVSARQQLSNTDIILPYTFDKSKPLEEAVWYFEAKRTLCLYAPKKENRPFKHNTRLIITVDTANQEGGIMFNLRVSLSGGLLLHVDEERNRNVTVSVSPMATTYFRFHGWSQDVNVIEVSFSSEGEDANICTIVAADDPYCPVYDLEETITKVKAYKRMTSTAVLRLSASEPEYERGLMIIIIPLSSDESCLHSPAAKRAARNPSRAPETSLKRVTVSVRAAKEHHLAIMIFIELGIFGACLILALPIFFICHYCYLKPMYEELKAAPEVPPQRTSLLPDESSQQSETTQTVMTYQDILDRSDPHKLTRRHNRYCTVTTFISAYFAIPVSQFILFIWRSMSQTGNFDHCYYNELCRVKTEHFSDFNHFISNLLYILFGIVFIGLVYWRRYSLLGTADYIACGRGLRVPFGAYIALGLSLIMEGVLSALYHFCPSGSTFQFDVAFMYVIAVIIISILHQLRFHASPSGTKAFFLLTILTIVSAVFNLVEHRLSEEGARDARLAFAVLVHAPYVLMYCVGLILHGTLKNGEEWHIHFYGGIYHFCVPKRVRAWINRPREDRREVILKVPAPGPGTSFWVTKIVTAGLLLIANVAASIFVAIKSDFAHWLLAVLITNAIVVLIIYVAWKIFYRTKEQEGEPHKDENRRVPKWPFVAHTAVYFAIALVTGAYGVYKFTRPLTEWRASAAESRAINKPCIEFWGGHYDHHDVWHFFSAVALFFSFLGLLTIDDGIIMENRRRIPVF